jgi:alpha/beta superfamily hydrolase
MTKSNNKGIVFSTSSPLKRKPPKILRISFSGVVGCSSQGYYDQEQANLHGNKTVLAELWDEHPTTPEKEIRSILGGFLFSIQVVGWLIENQEIVTIHR